MTVQYRFHQKFASLFELPDHHLGLRIPLPSRFQYSKSQLLYRYLSPQVIGPIRPVRIVLGANLVSVQRYEEGEFGTGYGVGFEIKIPNSLVSLYMDIQYLKMYIVSVDSTFASRHWSISDN